MSGLRPGRLLDGHLQEVFEIDAREEHEQAVERLLVGRRLPDFDELLRGAGFLEVGFAHDVGQYRIPVYDDAGRGLGHQIQWRDKKQEQVVADLFPYIGRYIVILVIRTVRPVQAENRADCSGIFRCHHSNCVGCPAA